MNEIKGDFVAGLVVNGELLIGWAFQPHDPTRRFIVEIDADDVGLAVQRAETFLPFLREQGHGDGCYGFAFVLAEGDAAGRHAKTYRLRIANTSQVLAMARREPAGDKQVTSRLGGHVVWRGGIRMSGVLRGRSFGTRTPTIQVFEGSTPLDVAVTATAGEDPSRETAFDLFLPPALADGALHMTRVLDQDGTELDGSPVWVLADPGGFRSLARRLSDRDPRTDPADERLLDYLDLLVPASLPIEDFGAWAKAVPNDGEAPMPGVASLGVVILGRAASQPTLASLRAQSGSVSLRAGIVDVDAAGCFRPEQFAEVCKALTTTTETAAILVVRGGTSFESDACTSIVAAMKPSAGESAASLCFADHSLFDAQGHQVPMLGPAFDYERLLSQGYSEGIFALVPALAAGLALSGARICGYDVVLAAVERLPAPSRAAAVVHVPRILASVPQIPPAAASMLLRMAVERHAARIGVTARIVVGKGSMTLPLVTVERELPKGSVEIVIPTRDRLDLLRPCLESLLQRTRHPNYRVTVIDNGSVMQETIAYLEAKRSTGAIDLLRDDGPFNYASLNNAAVARSTADVICFLNNDIEIVDEAWLVAMHRMFSRPGVAGVGAKLVWPNRMLQHGGVVLGSGFAASHGYDRYLADEPGYLDGILAARECGALTAACLLVRRRDFLTVGGFDATAFPVTFNDVDLCLKLRAAGGVLVWTPQAELLHKESASRGSDAGKPWAAARGDKELAELRKRWGRALATDPYYNPNLNLDAYTYTGLALPPRDRRPRRNLPPRRAMP